MSHECFFVVISDLSSSRCHQRGPQSLSVIYILQSLGPVGCHKKILVISIAMTSVSVLVLIWSMVALSHAFAPPRMIPTQQTHPKRQVHTQFMLDPSHVAFVEGAISTTSSHLPTLWNPLDVLGSAGILLADTNADTTANEPASYSKWSYYTTLSLYALSFPGIWSQIKRSTKAKLKRKTYVSAGQAVDGGMNLRQQAGEIMAYMKANNYQVVEAGEVITFRGIVQKSKSQAFFLFFITALALASLALVLQIQFQDVSLPLIGNPNWFYLVLLSPYAGIYYWKSGDRVDDVKVKLASNDDDTENEIVVEGDDEELDRMWRALKLREKGMVKVEGLLSA